MDFKNNYYITVIKSFSILALMLMIVIPLAMVAGTALASSNENILADADKIIGIISGFLTIILGMYALSAFNRWKEKSNEYCLQTIWGARKNVNVLRDYVKRDILSFDNRTAPEREAASSKLYGTIGGYDGDRQSRGLKNALSLEDHLMILQARSDSPDYPAKWSKLHPGRNIIDQIVCVVEVKSKITEENFSRMSRTLGVQAERDRKHYKQSSSGQMEAILDEVDCWLSRYESSIL